MAAENFIWKENSLRYINGTTRPMCHQRAAIIAVASASPSSTLSQTWMFTSFRFTCQAGMERMSWYSMMFSWNPTQWWQCITVLLVSVPSAITLMPNLLKPIAGGSIQCLIMNQYHHKQKHSSSVRFVDVENFSWSLFRLRLIWSITEITSQQMVSLNAIAAQRHSLAKSNLISTHYSVTHQRASCATTPCSLTSTHSVLAQ